MKRVACLVAIVLLFTLIPAFAADITQPGDPVVGVPNDSDWPDAETPPMAIDDNGNTKFLHFKGASAPPTGIRVTPTHNDKVVVGLSFTTANDHDDRDPVAWELRGSNDSINGSYTTIASGRIVDFEQATGWPRYTKNTTPIVFENTTVYQHYEILITEVRDPGVANSMQIAEIELLDGTPSVDVGGPYLLRSPLDTIQFDPTVTDIDSGPEDFTYLWTQTSGPGTVDFGGTETMPNATAVFPSDKGYYELELLVTDEMGNDANDVLQVRVWDPATEDAMVAYYTFNEGQGTIINDSTDYNEDGLLGARPEGSEPNFAPGWIPGDAPNNYALEFSNLGYVEVVPDPNSPSPNLSEDVQWSISIAGWFNANDWDGNRRILQKGASDNQFRLLAEDDQFVFHLSGVGRLEGPLPVAGQWHHAAATYDGWMMRLYLDGAEVASLEASGLIDSTQDALFIGTKHKDVTVVGDYFMGLMDDLRIYNYALDEDEILGLVALGENAPPLVSVVDPEDLVLSVQNYIDMDATAFDVNGDAITYKWTSSDPDHVTFEPSDNVEDVRAVFAQAGTYTLRLSVADYMYGLDDSIFAEVQVAVTNPTCEDVIAAGLGMFGDKDEDCDVDLVDFAAFAANWLLCNDPLNPNCINPFQEE
ncbi:MAG: LamG domain-containing protein [Sedimentisphaerales bacterium]|nr:LamG domain-containing protein [Sedimentisphaerales bacterium]